MGISPNINGETERVYFLKTTLGLLVSKTRVNIDPILVYYSDYRCIPELLKIVRLLYKGYEGESDENKNCTDFSLPAKFDKRKAKNIAKAITEHGHSLYDLLGKENVL